MTLRQRSGAEQVLAIDQLLQIAGPRRGRRLAEWQLRKSAFPISVRCHFRERHEQRFRVAVGAVLNHQAQPAGSRRRRHRIATARGKTGGSKKGQNGNDSHVSAVSSTVRLRKAETIRARLCKRF